MGQGLIKDMTIKEVYKYLIGAIGPRPIAWISTRSAEGVDNLAPFSFFSIIGQDPPTLSVSILRKGGLEKDTASNLLNQGQAVVHVVDRDNVDLANQTAANLKADISEAGAFDIPLQASSLVEPASIKQAKIRFETQMVHHHPLVNDEGIITADVFFLEVLAITWDDQVVKEGYIDYQALNSVGRLAGNDYSQLGSIFTIERPN
ncbi:TPA: flavin reductase family protein [Streptococcus suis]